MRRHLYESDGRFTEHHIQDWQHSAMYLAFLLAGFVDLMSHYTALPVGLDQVTPLRRASPVCLNRCLPRIYSFMLFVCNALQPA